MTAEVLGLSLGLSVFAAAPGLLLLLLDRMSRRRPRQAILCEAIGGPCDGRTWFLPELAPIWLRYGEGRHLYRPEKTGGSLGSAARYAYAGVSEPLHFATIMT